MKVIQPDTVTVEFSREVAQRLFTESDVFADRDLPALFGLRAILAEALDIKIHG